MPLSDFDHDFDAIIGKVPMHSHDRTMLANLGFADPDKKNPLHDLACLYLTQPETIKKLGEWMIGQIPKLVITENLDSFGYEPREVTGTGATEFHLQKGKNQYATTVGFIDALFKFYVTGVVEDWVTEQRVLATSRWEKCSPFKVTQKVKSNAIVTFAEVKIQPIPFGDALRQMTLYRDYLFAKHADDALLDNSYPYGSLVPNRTGRKGMPIGLLVAPWDISAAETDALNKAKFAFLKLGRSFEEWRTTAVAAKPSAVEL